MNWRGFIAAISLTSVAVAQPMDLRKVDRLMFSTIQQNDGPVVPAPPEHVAQRVFQRLMPLTRRRQANYQLRIIQDGNTYNAYSQSDGLVIVSTRLINELNDEDAIAFVLAHEVAHVEGEHIQKTIKGSPWSNLFAALLKPGTDSSGTQTVDLVRNLFDSGISRGCETDADEAAYRMLYQASFNPAGGFVAIRTLQRIEQSYGKKAVFPTHPTTSDRLTNLRDWGPGLLAHWVDRDFQNCQALANQVRGNSLDGGDADNQARGDFLRLTEELGNFNMRLHSDDYSTIVMSGREISNRAAILRSQTQAMTTTGDQSARVQALLSSLDQMQRYITEWATTL